MLDFEYLWISQIKWFVNARFTLMNISVQNKNNVRRFGFPQCFDEHSYKMLEAKLGTIRRKIKNQKNRWKRAITK